MLYDSATNAPQKLVSQASGPPVQPRFVSAHRVAYIETTSQGTSRIMSLDLSTRTPTVVVSATGLVPAFAYTHDGSTLAYLVHDPLTGNAALHWHRGTQDTTYPLNHIPGRGVSRDDELRLEYSSDDHYLLMLDTFVGEQGQAPETGQFIVFRADHTVAFVPPSGTSSNATHAAWSKKGNRLYYRDATGVRTWDPEVPQVGTLVAGLHWYDPSPSADGHWIAYTDVDRQNVPRAKLYDLDVGHTVDATMESRSHPAFVTPESLWYLEETPCTSECLGGPFQASGKVFAYNLTTKTESVLPFTDVVELSDLQVLTS